MKLFRQLSKVVTGVAITVFAVLMLGLLAQEIITSLAIDPAAQALALNLLTGVGFIAFVLWTLWAWGAFDPDPNAWCRCGRGYQHTVAGHAEAMRDSIGISRAPVYPDGDDE